MRSNFKRLGDYIRLVDVRNNDKSISNLKGININKEFMPSVANVSQTDLSKYKIIKKEQFAYSAMQVGRDECIRVALYDYEKPAIISPAYLVFEVIDSNEIDPHYLMMWFKRPESDRMGWFRSDGSVRASLEWGTFCDLQLSLPSIDRQRELVAIYISILSQIDTYEKSIPRLQKICEDYIVEAKKNESIVELGEGYIKQVDERNENGNTNIKGISTSKLLIDTIANISGVDLTKYKCVKPNQFAYVSDTSRRGDKIAIAKNENDECIVSSIYTVFETKQEDLLPDYLMIWFRRAEFDRYARYHSWGSARETFNWEDMCKVKIPLPSPKKQRSIVAIYNAMQVQKQLLQKLKDKLTTLCPVLAKGAEIE